MKSEAAQVRRRIHALQRRALHLEQRIAASDIDLSYDKQELGALRWALRELCEKFADILT